MPGHTAGSKSTRQTPAIRITVCAVALLAGCREPVRTAVFVPPKPLLRPGSRPVRAGAYEICQRCEKNSHRRHVYVRSSPDAEWLRVYSHERSVTIQSCVAGKLLINDFFATKAVKVVVVDAEAGAHRRIDEAAMAEYAAEARPHPALILVPMGQALSPCGEFALIVIELIYVSGPPEDHAVATASFQPRTYVVRTSDGSVAKRYPSARVPAAWWPPDAAER
ncbi:MAG: hypothetical protein JW909_05345 [Planctomycetes bacterium]|nr:hypothetical protein [Planctomycetota bacterium]